MEYAYRKDFEVDQAAQSLICWCGCDRFIYGEGKSKYLKCINCGTEYEV